MVSEGRALEGHQEQERLELLLQPEVPSESPVGVGPPDAVPGIPDADDHGGGGRGVLVGRSRGQEGRRLDLDLDRDHRGAGEGGAVDPGIPGRCREGVGSGEGARCLQREGIYYILYYIIYYICPTTDIKRSERIE